MSEIKLIPNEYYEKYYINVEHSKAERKYFSLGKMYESGEVLCSRVLPPAITDIVSVKINEKLPYVERTVKVWVSAIRWFNVTEGCLTDSEVDQIIDEVTNTIDFGNKVVDLLIKNELEYLLLTGDEVNKWMDFTQYKSLLRYI